jgi:competence protein ComEA
VPDLVSPEPDRPLPAHLARLLDSVSPARLVGAAGVVLLVAAASWWLLRSPEPPVETRLPMAPGAGSTVAAPPTTGGVLVVQAAGAVSAPGVYRVASGARVADLLELAGPAADADLQALALARLLHAGQRVWVPRVGEPVTPPVGVDGGPAVPVGPLDLNTATAEQLDTLPGVGPATASRILEHRARVGRFRRVEDLLDVAGIGPARLEALAGLVVVR